MILPPETLLEDDSYLSTIHAAAKDRRHRRNGLKVRVIDSSLDGAQAPEPMYRLITTILKPAAASAIELAEGYHERWEIEMAFTV